MPGYVDGFVLPLPKQNVEAYRKIARDAAKVWMDHGALEYLECVGDDLGATPGGMGISFPQRINTKAGETVVFAWIRYRSKAHRDRVNAKVMKDPRMQQAPKDMPFDVKRMLYGGFKVLVES
jgi:uncharacterized protein YbaA (DUF1428 family)